MSILGNYIYFDIMLHDLKTYLEWRCRMNWPKKYLIYIDEWISNVTESQIEYFIRERQHLINNGTYHI